MKNKWERKAQVPCYPVFHLLFFSLSCLVDIKHWYLPSPFCGQFSEDFSVHNCLRLSSRLSFHIIFQLQSLTKDSSCKSDFNTIIAHVSWSHVQTLVFINEKEALQRSLCMARKHNTEKEEKERGNNKQHRFSSKKHHSSHHRFVTAK